MSLINDALKKAQSLQARKAAGLPIRDKDGMALPTQSPAPPLAPSSASEPAADTGTSDTTKPNALKLAKPLTAAGTPAQTTEPPQLSPPAAATSPHPLPNTPLVEPAAALSTSPAPVAEAAPVEHPSIPPSATAQAGAYEAGQASHFSPAHRQPTTSLAPTHGSEAGAAATMPAPAPTVAAPAADQTAPEHARLGPRVAPSLTRARFLANAEAAPHEQAGQRRRQQGTSRDRRPMTLLAVGGGMLAVALVVLGVAVWMILGRPEETPSKVAQSDSTPASGDAPAIAGAGVGNVPTDPAAVAPSGSASPAPTTTPADAGAPPTISGQPVEVVTTAMTEPPPVTEPVKPPPPPKPKVRGPDPFRVKQWMRTIELSGIRAGARPKVLMNDRVFTIGDVVNPDLGLTLVAIDPAYLTFEDPAGERYELRF